MRRKEDQPLEKVTLNLFAGQKDKLLNLHGKLGYGKVIRTLVDKHIRRAEEHVAQHAPMSELKVDEEVLEEEIK